MARKRQRTTPHKRPRKTEQQSTSASLRKSKEVPTFAGMLHDGSRLATIEEVLDPNIATRTWKDLSSDETNQLCLRRITNNNNFIAMRMLGTPNVIDKKKALSEIKKQSPIGLHLLEIERRYIRLQLERHYRPATEGRK